MKLPVVIRAMVNWYLEEVGNNGYHKTELEKTTSDGNNIYWTYRCIWCGERFHKTTWAPLPCPLCGETHEFQDWCTVLRGMSLKHNGVDTCFVQIENNREARFEGPTFAVYIPLDSLISQLDTERVALRESLLARHRGDTAANL